jgi:hypothetical protein
MKVRMKLAVVVAMIGLAVTGIAGGDAVSRRLDGGVVALTNSQANSSWAVVAVLVRFDAAATGTAAVRRESQGASYMLGTCSYVGTTNLVWVPDLDYGFGYGDVLVVESSATNGVLQVMRKGD